MSIQARWCQLLRSSWFERHRRHLEGSSCVRNAGLNAESILQLFSLGYGLSEEFIAIGRLES
jgi:hypothetical protein